MSPKKSPPSRSINTSGGTYIEGDVHTNGDFVGRDKITYNAPVIHGNVSGETVVIGNNNVVGGKTEGASLENLLQLLHELRASLPQSGLDADTVEVIDADFGMIETQLAKTEPKKNLVLPKLQSVVATLTGLVGAGEAVEKLIPMVQQALQWAQQVIK
jgi:hypothetical protein